jgi:HPt (histidine-containing phosphotransfer) domain-containing protein
LSDGPIQLEPSALDALREIGGDDFLGDLIDTFLAEAPSQMEAIRGSLQRGDVDELRRTAHTLKSNGATFGGQSFAEACRELEERAKSGDLSGAAELVDRVEAEYTRFEQALVALREEAPS